MAGERRTNPHHYRALFGPGPPEPGSKGAGRIFCCPHLKCRQIPGINYGARLVFATSNITAHPGAASSKQSALAGPIDNRSETTAGTGSGSEESTASMLAVSEKDPSTSAPAVPVPNRLRQISKCGKVKWRRIMRRVVTRRDG